MLQVDGYAAYDSLAGDKKTSGKIRLAFCLVHARRNFVKVHKTTNSLFAREVIERIAAVYVIEETPTNTAAENLRTGSAIPSFFRGRNATQGWRFAATTLV